MIGGFRERESSRLSPSVDSETPRPRTSHTSVPPSLVLRGVLENLRGGRAQSGAPVDSADFMRAVLPLIASGSKFVLGTMDERSGFEWMIPPDEPVEKAQEDKSRPSDAPTLRRTPKP